jgi:hypothetical protein
MTEEQEKDLINKVNYLYNSTLSFNDFGGRGHFWIIVCVTILLLKSCK